MTTSDEEPRNTADLRGPGDPEEAKQPAQAPQSGQHPELPGASNIREEQQAHAAGTVPASYSGRGEPPQEHKPEEALGEPGTWDDDV
ncbi:putative uncharacterized protein [Pseudarthrobacter siccitolerans]|uniref:Uncharacterized protein n=1 Tax=Pseudarthrobacter siccitolerans TaxID=861266 RepID=A0A024GWR8_9MICC|nr:hypothetical protein [Pseudarthrobacter siccitolerans]CCQ44395.1 putative uncharacterized protein [Pseudarthrobacter siccitolerans]